MENLFSDDLGITIAFSEGQISIQSACNRYFAGYTQEGTTLSFDPAGNSSKYCEGLMDHETDYLQTLNKAAGYTLSGDTLTMLVQPENVLLVFIKQTLLLKVYYGNASKNINQKKMEGLNYGTIIKKHGENSSYFWHCHGGVGPGATSTGSEIRKPGNYSG